jgi:hypothetical protein
MAARTPSPARPLLVPQPRRQLTRVEFAQLILAQKGRCPACGDRLRADEIIDEHLVPLDLGGSNDLENRALFCLACAKEKTIDDVAASVHGRRVRGEIGQKRRRELRKLKPWSQQRTFPTNRNGRWRRRMNGQVVRRRKRRRYRRTVSYLGRARNAARREPSG